jgi:hypothetical protein
MIHQNKHTPVNRVYAFDRKLYDRAVRIRRSAIGISGPSIALEKSTNSTKFGGLFTAGFSSTVLQSLQSDRNVTVATGVSSWGDTTANARNAIQATGAKQPLVTAGVDSRPGILFDGSDDFLNTAGFALPAPGTTPFWIGLVFRVISWTSGRYIIGDSNGVAGTIYQSALTPEARGYAGVNGPVSSKALGTWECSEIYFSNTTADYFKRGSSAAVTGTVFGNSVGVNRVIGNGGASNTLATNVEFLHIIYVLSPTPTETARWRANVAQWAPSVQV